jgi:hypothetical protein
LSALSTEADIPSEFRRYVRTPPNQTRERAARVTDTTRAGSHLESLLASVRALITTEATPPHLPDDVLLAWFTSKLWGVRFELRPAVVPTNLFGLLTEILRTVPAPALVNAICLAVECVLRPAPTGFWSRRPEKAEQEYSAFTKMICSAELKKALCKLMAPGAEYASREVLQLLRYFDVSSEFEELSREDSVRLVRLCEMDRQSAAFKLARQLHVRRQLEEYAQLPFAKPVFPLGEECQPLCFYRLMRIHPLQLVSWVTQTSLQLKAEL